MNYKNNKTILKNSLNNLDKSKTQVTSQKTKKDLKELNSIIIEKSNIETLKSKLEIKSKEVLEQKEQIKQLFNRSNKREIELKNYIAEINAKIMFPKIESNSNNKINDMHSRIMSLIDEIHDKVKTEVHFSKKELENEIVDQFNKAEKKNLRILDEKINEQNKVFQKMKDTKTEIEKIRFNFDNTNEQSEKLAKENENLRIYLEAIIEDNKSLNNKIIETKEEFKKLYNKKKRKYNNEELANPFNVSIDNNVELDKSLNYYKIENRDSDGNKSVDQSNIYKSNELTMENPEVIVSSLKGNIKKLKDEYLSLNKNYLNDLIRKNEAQQLILKCIEDLKLDISKTQNEITNLMQMNQNIFTKYSNEISAKQNNLIDLENKLKIMTFIYDKGFENKKNKIVTPLSPSIKNNELSKLNIYKLFAK